MAGKHRLAIFQEWKWESWKIKTKTDGSNAMTRQQWYVHKTTEKAQVFWGLRLNPKLTTAEVHSSFPWAAMTVLFQGQLNSNKQPRVCISVLQNQPSLLWSTYSEMIIEL